jgi:ABC-type antimicrobial peptide transport system permease subunit
MRQVAAIEEQIKDMGYGTHSMESERKRMEDENRQLQIIMGAIGGITLLVAVISIANTMIMSVYERTREIGVMKVLGCLIPDIRTIFLFEAGLIGFIGGILGVGLSYGLSFVINSVGGNIGNIFGGGGGWGWGMDQSANASIIAPWMVLMGLGFATIIGVVAGFYPAHRAVKISALEAIRQE